MRVIFIFLLALVTAAQAQQINPVPDYIFRNQMSVGRNAATDSMAYFSVGPRYGAVKGMMPPMVVDTALVVGAVKRNGLFIFSVQKNKYVYWDSVGMKWAEMAGTAGNALTSADTSFLLSTKAYRQKGIDSLASLRVSGTGITGYIPKWTATRTQDTSQLFQSAGFVAIGNVAPAYKLDVTGTLRNTTGAAFATSSGNVLIGTTTDAGYKLDIAGTLRNTTGANFATSSGNVVINSTGTGTQKLEVVGGDALIHSIRIGRGNNALSTNVIYGNTGGSITTGGNNNFIGNSAGISITDGNLNLAVGNSALGATTSSVSVTAVGIQALQLSTGSENTALGRLALQQLIAGNQNTALGTRAGEYVGVSGSPALTNISNSILIGYSARASKDSNTNEIVIAHQGRGNGSNTVTIGNSSTTQNYFFGSLNTSAPTSGSAKPWRLGEVATVSPTSPNRTIRVEIEGVVYYIHAKTTND